MQIIENLIPKNWQEDLLKISKELPFQYSEATSYKIEGEPDDFMKQGWDIFVDENTIDTYQYVNAPLIKRDNFFSPSCMNFLPLTYLIEERLGQKILDVRRIKINCLNHIPNFTKNNYNLAHTDGTEDLLTVIYYLNDSDGDTFVFNEFHDPEKLIDQLTVKARVTPKMGNALVIPSRQFHASSNPINTPSRFVINFLLEMEK